MNPRAIRTFQSLDKFLDSIGEIANERMKVGGFPFHDVIAVDDTSFRIDLALAGYTEEELEIVTEGTSLTVSANKVVQVPEGRYIRRGITKSSFTRSFQLPLHSVISGAELKNGVLSINIKIEVPEDQKPRKIEILKKKSAEATSEDSETASGE